MEKLGEISLLILILDLGFEVRVFRLLIFISYEGKIGGKFGLRLETKESYMWSSMLTVKPE